MAASPEKEKDLIKIKLEKARTANYNLSVMGLFQKLFGKKIQVFALVGGSGTGKSFRAKLIAEKNSIDAIIDDGLLIRDDKILAGKSAKHEKTYMGAVRIALFDEKAHRDSVAKEIQKSNMKKILIIGTSQKMVSKICTRLQLPQPSKIINIEDIATQDEITKAIRSRQIEGKHVIPVPAIEVKKTYSQIFSQSIREKISKSKFNIFAKKDSTVAEKSIVTPEFSKKGRLEISEAALSQMVIHCVSESDPQVRIKKLTIKTDSHGYRLVLTVDVPFGKQLTGVIHNMQNYIIEKIETYTGILIEEVSIIIDKITTEDTDMNKANLSRKKS